MIPLDSEIDDLYLNLFPFHNYQLVFKNANFILKRGSFYSFI